MVKVNIKYIFLLLISYLFFFLIGGELFNSIFYISLILLIIAIIYMILGKLFLNIKVDCKEQDYYVGDNLIMNIRVKNKTFLPFPYVYINSESFSRVIYIQWYKKLVFKNKIELNKRGLYEIENLKVEIKDIFNIFNTNKTIVNEKKIKVYPRVCNIEEFLSKIKALDKKKFSFLLNLDENNLVRDIRKYEIGDSLKKVHWKLSAKYGELLVKNFEKKHGNDINILLYLSDLSKDKYRDIDEEVVSFFVSLVNYIMYKGFNIRIFISSRDNKVINIRNHEDFRELLEYFLGDEYYFKQNFNEFIQENFNRLSKAIVFCIGEEDSVDYSIENLKGSGKNIDIINYKELLQGENYEEI